MTAARTPLRGHAFAALLFLLVGLASRVSTFGDPNLFVDDPFYFLVGQRMHEGLLPYVDVWDRKPLGLFLIYYLIAGVSTAVVAYQIAAWLFAAGTALAIYGIVFQWTNRQGALIAGIAYLVMLGAFGGSGGQSPVFYNLFVAAAAWLVARELEPLSRGIARWPIAVAMALCGLAIAVKQTALFESLFLGLYVVVALWRAGAAKPRVLGLAALYAMLGAAPMLASAAFYAAVGHSGEFWHAMVTANLTKGAVVAGTARWQLLGIVLRAAPVLAVALFGLVRERNDPRRARFVAAWLIAALAGFLSVPNFFVHYTLPLLPPLAVGAGLVFARGRWGRIVAVALAGYYLLWSDFGNRGWTEKSIRSMDLLAEMVRKNDGGGGLLVYDGPPYLYAMTGKRFLSPLVFPHHLNHAIERNTSWLDTDAEFDRIVAARPGVIVTSLYPRNLPVNRRTYAALRNYAHAHCRIVGITDVYEQLVVTPVVVFGDCR